MASYPLVENGVEVLHYDCVRNVLEPWVWDVVRMWRVVQQYGLPEAGAPLDQSAWLMGALEIVEDVVAKKRSADARNRQR